MCHVPKGCWQVIVFLSRNKISCAILFFTFFFFLYFPEGRISGSLRRKKSLWGKRQISHLWDMADVPTQSLVPCSLQGMEEYPSLPGCFIPRKAVCHCRPGGVVSPPILPLRLVLSLCRSCSPAYFRLQMKGKDNVGGEDSLGAERAPAETRGWQKCPWLQ